MSSFTTLPAKVQKLIEDLNSNFWQEWTEQTSKFPDTLDCSSMALISLQSSIVSICTNYIMGFSIEKRSMYLEELIKSLRYMEMQLRDVEAGEL